MSVMAQHAASPPLAHSRAGTVYLVPDDIGGLGYAYRETDAAQADPKTVVGRLDDFDVGSTERKLGRLNAGGTGFDFVNPVEEPTYRRLIAASGFGSELHCCRL
jgi:hypothetical protein